MLITNAHLENKSKKNLENMESKISQNWAWSIHVDSMKSWVMIIFWHPHIVNSLNLSFLFPAINLIYNYTHTQGKFVLLVIFRAYFCVESSGYSPLACWPPNSMHPLLCLTCVYLWVHTICENLFFTWFFQTLTYIHENLPKLNSWRGWMQL